MQADRPQMVVRLALHVPSAPKWARGHGRLFPKPLAANLRCLSDQTSHQYLQPLTFEASSPRKISHVDVDDRGIHVMAKLVLFQQHISRDL